MRVFFPLLTLLAVVVFGVSAIAAAILSFALPAILLGLMVATIARPFIAVRLGAAGFKALGGAFGLVGDFFRCLFAPLKELEPELDDSSFPPLWVRLKPARFIALHRVQQEVAAALGVPTVDELWISPDTALGIGQQKLEGQRVRFMVVGLGLLHVLGPEELRAAIAHEYGHALAGHLRLGRWIRHTVRVLLDARLRFAVWNPALWGSAVALGLMRGIYLPWSRAREMQADQISARLVGGATAAAALRKVRDVAPGHDLALVELLHRAQAEGVAPTRLVECAQRRMQRIPAAARLSMARQLEGDPLDLGGRTHPPIAMRVAALNGLKAAVSLGAVPAFDPRQLADLDERLTRQWLSSIHVREWVSAESLAVASPPPTPVLAARSPTPPPETPAALLPRTAEELAKPTSDGLELDLDRSWQKRRE